MSVIYQVGQSFLFELIQIVIGCLLAYLLYRTLSKKSDIVEELNKESILLMVLASLIGLGLPMGIYGIIPIFLATIQVGIRFSLTLPLLVSNFLFNMLVPFMEVGFSWERGIFRIVLAFIMGLVAGLMAGLLKIDPNKVIRQNNTQCPQKFTSLLNGYLMASGVFLILGVILEVIFKEYFYYDFINVFNISRISTVVFSFIKGYDITTDVFLINMFLFNLVMNLKTLSGVVFLFKWKGALGYYVYFGLWVALLCMVNIFV